MKFGANLFYASGLFRLAINEIISFPYICSNAPTFFYGVLLFVGTYPPDIFFVYPLGALEHWSIFLSFSFSLFPHSRTSRHHFSFFHLEHLEHIFIILFFQLVLIFRHYSSFPHLHFLIFISLYIYFFNQNI